MLDASADDGPTTGGASAQRPVDVADAVRAAAVRARAAAARLARCRGGKDRALLRGGRRAATPRRRLVAANAEDVAAAPGRRHRRRTGRPADARPRPGWPAWRPGCATSPACPTRSGRWCAARPCPTGWSCARSGCPSAWSAIVYEGRPNVTVDAAGLCLKSGNAVLLRGSRRRTGPTRRWSRRPRRAASRSGCPPTPSQLVPGTDRDSGEGAAARPRAGRRGHPARRGRADRRRRRPSRRCRSSRRASGTATSTSTPTPTSTARWRSCSTPRSTGRRCATPRRRVLVHEAVAEAFLPRALAALATPG